MRRLVCLISNITNIMRALQRGHYMKQINIFHKKIGPVKSNYEWVHCYNILGMNHLTILTMALQINITKKS
jgi:hypothetical protein